MLSGGQLSVMERQVSDQATPYRGSYLDFI